MLRPGNLGMKNGGNDRLQPELSDERYLLYTMFKVGSLTRNQFKWRDVLLVIAKLRWFHQSCSSGRSYKNLSKIILSVPSAQDNHPHPFLTAIMCWETSSRLHLDYPFITSPVRWDQIYRNCSCLCSRRVWPWQCNRTWRRSDAAGPRTRSAVPPGHAGPAGRCAHAENLGSGIHRLVWLKFQLHVLLQTGRNSQ